VIDVSERGTITAGRDPAAVVRFAIVALCVLGTACVFVACIGVVLGGHIGTLFQLIPWLAATALATVLVVTARALIGASRERLRNRQELTAEHITELARVVGTLEPAGRAQAEKRLIDRLDVTRDALIEVVKLDPTARDELVAGGLAARVNRELEGARSKWHRVSAAGVLGLLRDTSSIPPLSQALADPDRDVAYAAAQALAVYASPLAYEALLDALTGGTIAPSRVAALLEAFRCPTARELIEARAGSADRQVRYWVSYLLGRLADQRSARVVERLARDPDEDVRANAAESLAGFRDEIPLIRLLDDESWVVRSHAAKAAGVSGKTILAPRLAELLEDHSWWVRQNATLALADFGDAAVPALLAQLHSDDRFARNKAAEALIRSDYVAGQLECVKAGLPGVEEAREVLVDLGRAEALSTITNAVRTTSDPEARDRLLGVLHDIGTHQAKTALEQLGDLRALEPVQELRHLERLAQV
jgi:HEAT repeat protein